MVSTFRKLAGTEATQRLLVGMGKIRQWFELFEERIGYPGGNILQASANMELAPFKTYLWGWSWCESQIYKCDLSGDFSAPWLLGSSSWTHSLYPAHHEQFYLPSFHCARSRQWMKSLTKVRHKMVEVLFQRVQDEKKSDQWIKGEWLKIGNAQGKIIQYTMSSSVCVLVGSNIVGH